MTEAATPTLPLLMAVESLEKRGENWFCVYHSHFVSPILFARIGEEPLEACPECLQEELDKFSETGVKPPVSVVVVINKMCADGTCVREKFHACESCGKEFCENHITMYSGYAFCDECDPTKGTELNDPDLAELSAKDGIVEVSDDPIVEGS